MLVVALHVVGWSPTTGMHVGEGTFYRDLADLFAPLRMPLFTFLSGFVYAYRPVVAGRTTEFSTKKVRRLALPLLTLTTVYYLLTFVAGDVNGKMPVDEAWRIYLYPYVHLWFLQAILLIFAAIVVLERLGALATLARFLAVLLCSVAAGAAMGGLGYDSFFSHENAVYLLPFFLLGLGTNRFRGLFLRPAVAWTCALVLMVAAALHLGTVLELDAVTPEPIVLAIGFSGVLALIYFTPQWRPLERLGAYSFSIYLLHPFAVAPSRKALQALDLDSAAALFGVCLVAGIAAPIIFEHVTRRRPLAQRWLLGKSPSSAPVRTPPTQPGPAAGRSRPFAALAGVSDARARDQRRG